LRALGVYTLAVALEETGHYEESLQAYQKARELALNAGEAETTGVLDHATMAQARLSDFFDDLQQHKAERNKENEARAAKNLKPLPDERAEIAEALYAYDEGLDLKEKVLQDPGFVSALARARDEGGDPSARDALVKHAAYEQFQAAINRFNLAIAKYPRLPQACYQLGLCHLLSGNFKDARRTLETALAYSPYNFAALNLLGEVLLETGQGEQAAQTFRKVLAQDADSGPAHFGLGRALFQLQRNQRECENALTELDRAEELGLRDKRMYSTELLTRKDGTEYEGRIREKGENYIIELSDGKSVTVAKAEVQERIAKPGLRDRLTDRIQRFERGEAAPQGPKLHGKPTHELTEPDPVKDPWGQSMKKY
jgi:tetratricopeptide (TPR) repeat protein